LAVQLVLTAQNAKVLLSEELQSEFVREFENESPELLERAFQAWRRRSKFMPTISEIYDLLEEEAEARFREREAERALEQKADAARALKEWEDPAQKAEHAAMIADLGKKLTLVRLNQLGRPGARRSPENVIALSQAKVLRDLPPKKHPGMLGPDAGEPSKLAQKAVSVR
jgi:hypothetical protein